MVERSSLTEPEIAVIRAWADGGKPEGNPKDLPPAPTYVDGWPAGKPDAVVTIPKFELLRQGADEYNYVTVPTNFTEDRWVVSTELRAGNRKIVHHAHAFVLDPEPGGGQRENTREAEPREGLCELADGQRGDPFMDAPRRAGDRRRLRR